MCADKIDGKINVNKNNIPECIRRPEPETEKITISFKFPEFIPTQCLPPQKPEKFDTVKNMVAKFIPDVSDKFVNQIIEIAEKIKTTPENLTALIYKESKFSPQIKNGSYHGLGQMNKTSLQLCIDYAAEHPEEKEGINPLMSINKFAKLSREEQMPYVKNYILGMKKAYVKDMNKKMDSSMLNGLFVSPANVMKPSNKRLGQVLESIKINELAPRKNFINA